MSIRSKILSGCLALTLLSGLLGAFTQLAEYRIGQVGLDIYDNGLMAVSYLRSAQLAFSQLAGAQMTGQARQASRSARDDLLDDLGVVQERAMSNLGHAQTTALVNLVTAAVGVQHGTIPPANPAAVRRAEAAFDHVVEVFADDGFRYRRRVGMMVAQEERRGLIAIGATLLAALMITSLVSHLIAPPVRRAVAIAQAIAANRLDNAIDIRGRGETGDLLRALATMQSAIAAGMQRIRRLMDEQAASHADEIFTRNAQMEAALGNMNQGLCLFGADGHLLVANPRFSIMFGPPVLGRHATEILRQAKLEALIDAAGGGAVAAFSCDLSDGRTIAISQQTVAGGGWVATFEDVSERRRAEADLAYMARHDVLTDLPNRLLLSEHMRAIAGRAVTETIAVLAVDLDKFKWVNDTVGHSTGDVLLCAVADRLLACVKKSDLVVRLGNDEFAVVQVAAAQPGAARALADRIVAELGAPFAVDGQSLTIGVSLGVALSDSDPAKAVASVDDLLKCADLALYRAKADGGGGYNFFEAGMDARLQARRKLEQDLRQAIDHDQFEVFYQPLVKTGHGVSGFEALLRWRHPERGHVSPAVFIPVAEEIGLIGIMGSWVLRQACNDAAGWPGMLTVAVNLSPIQFRKTLADEVGQVLRSTGLDPARLQLEITESVLLQDNEHVLSTLHRIRDLGVRIAMDDFGTGYSSLGYLRRFPFDKIKIDQSFVRHMTEQSDCLTIIRAVIGLGRSLGMVVNAEGVETDAQRRTLIEEGCSELQGFLFSKPKPAGDVPEMIRKLATATHIAPNSVLVAV